MPQAHEPADTPVLDTVAILQWIAVAVGVVSVIREDLRARRRDAGV